MKGERQLKKERLYYDIEIFHSDAIVVFKREDKSVYRIFHNDFEGLYEVVQNHILCGYNNYYYDDKILSAMLDNYTPEQLKKLNDEIILNGKEYPVKHYIESLDGFQQIDPSMPGLKKIEGNMGKPIVESDVSFNIERKLTDKEIEEVIRYCCYDVDSTIEVFKARENYFETKEMLLDMLGKPSAKRWNTTTISANLLLKKPLVKWSGIRVSEDMIEMVAPAVQELWLAKDKGNVTIKEFDNDIVFGFGGLHGAHQHIKRAEKVKLLDVTSMYPHIILNINALGTATEKYKDIIAERVEVKHTDKKKSDALKLILNSVYGNLKNKYSMLFNPKAALSVCVYGQIALYILCEMIAPFVTIININTDGVAFTVQDERYKEVVPEWEQMFNLNLEEEDYDLFIQKDVNNYIAVKDKEIVKLVGADVKRYFKDSLFTNNNARILDIALVDKLIYGKDVLDSLMEHLDKPKLYQYILKAGYTYKGTTDSNFNEYNNVNRVFASKKGDLCLQKWRANDGLVLFADAPLKMYLWNEDVEKLKNFEEIVDLNHYYQVIMKRLERWE